MLSALSVLDLIEFCQEFEQVSHMNSWNLKYEKTARPTWSHYPRSKPLFFQRSLLNKAWAFLFSSAKLLQNRRFGVETTCQSQLIAWARSLIGHLSHLFHEGKMLPAIFHHVFARSLQVMSCLAARAALPWNASAPGPKFSGPAAFGSAEPMVFFFFFF